VKFLGVQTGIKHVSANIPTFMAFIVEEESYSGFSDTLALVSLVLPDL
jgi:hypothetical protein